MIDKPISSGNQGEGNRDAAKEYDEDTRAFIKAGKVKPAADAAEKSLDSPDKKDMEKAEREGRSHAKS